MTPTLTTKTTVVNKTTGLQWQIPLAANPEVSVIIVTTSGQTYDLKNVTAFSLLNSIGLNIPVGQISFVLDADEKPPNVGPMDEVYIYANTFDLTSITSNELSNNSKDILFRIYTGKINKVHQIWDNKLGKVFQLEVATNMKNFDVTAEYKPLSGYDSPAIVNQSAFYTAQVTWPDPFEIIKIACQQSNVDVAFIYNGRGPSLMGTPSLLSKLNLPDDIETDPLGNATLNKYFPFKTVIPQQLNFAYWQFNKWDTILANITNSAFTEMFFNKYGQFYYRQLGMFRQKGSYDIEIPSEIIHSYDIFETDETIITRLELRWPGGPNTSPVLPYVWTPPNVKELEARYGPRYQMLDVPWASYSANKLVSNVNDKSQALLQSYLKDFATLTLGLANANAIQGQIKLYGCNAFEVGQTIYLPTEQIVAYITNIQYYYKIGEGYFTILTVSYARSPNIDFITYLNVGSGVLGDISGPGLVTVQDLANAQNPNQVPNQLSGSSLDNNVANQPIGQQGNPFLGNPSIILTQGYGTNAVAYNSSDGLHHTGIDLDASLNGTCSSNVAALVTPVVAGRVVQVGSGSLGSGITSQDHDGWGNFVIIRSENTDPILDFAYCHLQSVNVSIGDEVIPQQTVLGQVGSTGNSTACHLHFQVQQQGWYEPDWVFTHTVDPAKFLNVNVLACTAYKLNTYSPISGLVPGFSFNSQQFCPNGPNLSTCPGPLQNYLIDDNYSENIKNWATTISGYINARDLAVIAYLMALADQETGYGKLLVKPYNYGNVGAYDGNIGSALSYSGINESALSFSNLLLSFTISIDVLNKEDPHSRYSDIIDYFRNYKPPFDPVVVAKLFVANGYKSDSAYITTMKDIYTARLQQLQGI